MLKIDNQTIWLAYVSYPVTTAVFFERALRKEHKVFTCGPMISDGIIKKWNLENMKLEVNPQDLPFSADVDIEAAYNSAPDDIKPDLFLWIESVNGYYPQNIKKLKIPTACYLIDSHLNLPEHLEWSKNFDYVFIAQREYLPDFKKAGIENVHWLPLGCDPEVHVKLSDEKKYEIGFVGSLTGNPRREVLLKSLKNSGKLYYERSFWLDMAKVFSESKVVFNNAVKNDLNMRVFEVMSTGSFLLTDNASNSAQDELFVPHEDMGIYYDASINDAAEFYLGNDELREAIAIRGKEIAHNAHTYAHRADEIIKMTLGGTTQTPTAKEWRTKSLDNLSVSSKDINKLKRSFVIPVLDYSPASEFSIKTLLDDLEEIEGNIIIIFNSEKVAEEMKDHPRIDYYAVMGKNVGVARAWNIGLDISQTPITFILNADLSIQKETIEKLEANLIQLPKAAIVGPQGSYFNFSKAKDLAYLDKGMFNSPIEVDAVSGFLFAVKTKYFHEGTLIFENKYTPCYFEEWDIGLQVKKAGLKNWVVPCTEYEHEWSGTIRALRTIKYLDKEETAGEILKRNRQIFWKKWQTIDEEYKAKHSNTLLDSLWLNPIIKKGEELLADKQIDEAENIFNALVNEFPANKHILTNLGVIEFYKGDPDKAKINFNKALEIDPEFETAKENLEMMKKNYSIEV